MICRSDEQSFGGRWQADLDSALAAGPLMMMRVQMSGVYIEVVR
jgi:hypothetical protein